MLKNYKNKILIVYLPTLEKIDSADRPPNRGRYGNFNDDRNDRYNDQQRNDQRNNREGSYGGNSRDSGERYNNFSRNRGGAGERDRYPNPNPHNQGPGSSAGSIGSNLFKYNVR